MIVKVGEIIRSPPIKSLPINVNRSGEYGNLYVSPEDLGSAESFIIKRRRLKLYADESGKHPVRPEWRERGVTIKGYWTGGSNRSGYILYEFL